MVFLNPLASTLKVWMVFFFVLNILFKSIWAWCGMGKLGNRQNLQSSDLKICSAFYLFDMNGLSEMHPF